MEAHLPSLNLLYLNRALDLYCKSTMTHGLNIDWINNIVSGDNDFGLLDVFSRNRGISAKRVNLNMN